jgi:hypothetical protein
MINRKGTFSDRMTQQPMAWIERFTCDICGKQQMSVDEKWWIAMNECATPLNTAAGQPTLKLMPWDNALAHSAESKHLCGAGCAHTFMDRWMAGFRAGTETCVDVATNS